MASTCVESRGEVALLDPILPPDDATAFWERLDARPPTMVVVLKPEADIDPAAVAETLQAWCRTQLAGYKCPRSFSIRPAMPLSAAGKILKTTLRAEHDGKAPA